MSWIVRGFKPHRRRAREFHRARERAEGFRSGYVEPTPEWTLIKAMLLPPDYTVIRAGGWYYESLPDYTERFLDLVAEVGVSRGWGFVRDVAAFSRRHGLVKDTAVIAAQPMPAAEAGDVLSTMHPILLERYVDLARKVPGLFGGLGRRKKRAVERAMASWPLRRHEVYAARYRRSLRNLLRTVHPRPPSGEVSEMWRWVLGKGDAPTLMLGAAERIISGRLDPEDAASLALEHRVPFEVVRSHVPITRLPPETVYELLAELATPIAAYSMLSTLLRMEAEDLALRLAERFADRVPVSYGFRAVVGLMRGHREFAERLDALLAPRAREAAREALLPLDEARDRAVFLIDVSASMMYTGIRRAATIAYALRGLADEVLVFNDHYMPPRPVPLDTLDDLEALMGEPSGGTPLVPAVLRAARRARELDAMLWVFTDEMGNIFDEENVARIPGDVPTLILNVAPYPSEHIVKEAGKVVGLPAFSVDTAKAGAKLLQILQVEQTEKIYELVLAEAREVLGKKEEDSN